MSLFFHRMNSGTLNLQVLTVIWYLWDLYVCVLIEQWNWGPNYSTINKSFSKVFLKREQTARKIVGLGLLFHWIEHMPICAYLLQAHFFQKFYLNFCTFLEAWNFFVGITVLNINLNFTTRKGENKKIAKTEDTGKWEREWKDFLGDKESSLGGQMEILKGRRRMNPPHTPTPLPSAVSQ